MTKDEFIKRFQLSALNQSVHLYRHPTPMKPAAVLIALIEEEQQISVVLTKRALHLKHHPGQISFPGGKYEPEDKSLKKTALREAQEEIGLNLEGINIIGNLYPYETISGYLVTPYIAFITKEQEYKIDKNEVSEIFHAPLQHFLNSDNHFSIDIHRKGRTLPIYFMPYNNYNIWGATAVMLKDLALHVE